VSVERCMGVEGIRTYEGEKVPEKKNARGYGGGNDIGERSGVQSEGTRSW